MLDFTLQPSRAHNSCLAAGVQVQSTLTVVLGEKSDSHAMPVVSARLFCSESVRV